MKRIKKLSKEIAKRYIESSIENTGHFKKAYGSAGWSKHIYFRADGLAKLSIRVPRCFLTKGHVLVNPRLESLLAAYVERDLKRGLGHFNYINRHTGEFCSQKRSSGLFYSRHDFKQFLKKAV